MSIFEQLRALDDREEPREVRFAGGLPMWPFVRWQVCCAAQERALGLQEAFASKPRRTLRQTAELVMRAGLRGPLSAGRFDIVMVSSSGGIVMQREGRWFDRINDYFAMQFPDRTLVLDKAGPHGYKTPRFPRHVRCFDTFDLTAGVIACVRRPSDRDLVSIDKLVRFLREHSPVELDSALPRIRATLAHWAARLPALRDSYARFFDRVQPRILLIEDASYGAFTHVCSWANAAGIATAEPQHGVISRSHLAYNYGEQSDLASCQPRYLLLYGEMWKEEIRTSSEPVVVGSPHFSEVARPAARNSRKVLTISQGICTERMVQLTSMLARRFPEREFVFRLHPGEVAFRERYVELTTIPNVEISDRGDIYRLLEGANAVIGHSSTALVEAAGIGLPVFAYADVTSRSTIPPEVATWFTTAEELTNLVESPPATVPDPARYFATDWRGRYRSFIERVSTSSASGSSAA